MNTQATIDTAKANGDISDETHAAFTALASAAATPSGDMKSVNLTDFIIGLFNWVKDNGSLIQQFYPLVLAIIASLKPKA